MYKIINKQKYWLKLLLVLSIILFYLLGIKSVSAKTDNYKKALLGTWLYVKTGRIQNTGELSHSIKGFIEFRNDGYALIEQRFDYNKMHSKKMTVARWSFDKSRIAIHDLDSSGKSVKPSNKIDHTSTHFMAVNFDFIEQHRPRKEEEKKHIKLFDRKERSFILKEKNTLYLNPRLPFRKREREKLANSQSGSLKYWDLTKSIKFIRLSEAKKLYPELFPKFWDIYQYRVLRYSKTAYEVSAYSRQNLFRCDYWKFRKADYDQCTVMKNIFFNHPGHQAYEPYKTVDNTPKVTNSSFLLKPITNYSDSTPIPSKTCYGFTQYTTDSKKVYSRRDNLKANGYKNTLWVLKVRPNTITLPKGGNKKEFDQYLNALIIWGYIGFYGGNLFTAGRSNLVHLRNDGVIGLTWDKSDRVGTFNGKPRVTLGQQPKMVYDPANRWSFDGNHLTLSWQNAISTYKFNLTKSIGVKGKYESAMISLIDDDQRLGTLISGIRVNKKIRQEIYDFAETQCESYKSTAQVTLTKQNSPQSQMSKPIKSKPTASLKKPVFKNSTWHARIVTVDPKMPFDPNIRALWGKGAYLYLRQDGQFGLNWVTPAAYGFDPNNRWTYKADKMTIHFGDNTYTFNTVQGGEKFTTLDDISGKFRMTMEQKSN